MCDRRLGLARDSLRATENVLGVVIGPELGGMGVVFLKCADAVSRWR